MLIRMAPVRFVKTILRTLISHKSCRKTGSHAWHYRGLIAVFCLSIGFWSMGIYKTGDKSHCFLRKNRGVDILQEISSSVRQPTRGKTIFFHETTCSETGIIHLNARQACAIESAAKMNPDWDIFILFASPVGRMNRSTSHTFIEQLLTYPNVHFRNVNLWHYAEDTPIAEWIQHGKLFQSKYMNSHVSDLLRYLSLWKWGGTYLDLDVIVKKSLSEIEYNYAGAESANFVAAGIISLDATGIGHEIAEMCLRDFKTNFNGNDWGNNGPGVITRVLHRLCQTQIPRLMTRERCFGFNVFPISSFYAIGWKNWRYFFEEQYLNETMRIIKESVIAHVWNKHSYESDSVRVGSQVAYTVLANQYCPKVYGSCGDFF